MCIHLYIEIYIERAREREESVCVRVYFVCQTALFLTPVVERLFGCKISILAARRMKKMSKAQREQENKKYRYYMHIYVYILLIIMCAHNVFVCACVNTWRGVDGHDNRYVITIANATTNVNTTCVIAARTTKSVRVTHYR